MLNEPLNYTNEQKLPKRGYIFESFFSALDFLKILDFAPDPPCMGIFFKIKFGSVLPLVIQKCKPAILFIACS